jgi:2-oxoglutarate dehydrogenase E2 component (dihydrolipoamide succinyltransferase)
MANFELVMPKMGESIMEATIINWAKNIGETVEVDETILEIATDKVDSEIPSPVKGIVNEIRYQVDEVVPIGAVVAIIQTEEEESSSEGGNGSMEMEKKVMEEEFQAEISPVEATAPKKVVATPSGTVSPSATKESIKRRIADRFYSPLVRNIAKKENISIEELEQIPGTGLQGRVTKKDMLSYIERKENQSESTPKPAYKKPADEVRQARKAIVFEQEPLDKMGEPERIIEELVPPSEVPPVSGDVEIIEMDRMRKMIAEHMIQSKRTSAHVTSFVEADVTEIVRWRNKVKAEFQQKYGTKLTFTPIFIDAVVKAIREYPMINISVEENKIIVKRHVNIGMATALPSGNLIVPVIKNADNFNLKGLAQQVNDLAYRARNGQLRPDEIQDGTFTVTNVGTFGNVMGTPIINQPQVAIMATGTIRKKPSIVETQYGDLIAIRHMMFLSLSYDHRVVDGFLGGSFLRKVADYLEQFNFEGKI